MANTQPDGYLATPAGGKGKPVLVLHAWWGLNDTIKAICTRLAEAGFIAFAPDFYHGQVVDSIADAETISGRLFENQEQARADVTTATKYLSEVAGPNGQSLAVIGFSLGAFFALDASVAFPEKVRTVVVFYGTRPGDYRASQAAYLGHFAESDEFEPEPNVRELEDSLKSAGRPVTFYRYQGTGHWFFEPDRVEAYNQAAASLAWNRTLDFLKGA
ncbi:MAG TPA: dienelactone hydrolase family protein [Chloroflexia bacterium]|nr:dienelactone hydrolase family protein [Chloroflexia bacterium]